MISSWLMDNDSTEWSEDLRYVQFMKNRAFRSGIKQSPYKALFGIEPRNGEDDDGGIVDIDTQNIEDATKLLMKRRRNILKSKLKKCKHLRTNPIHPPTLETTLLYQFQK
ncbi:unnamed protein product [Parnassius apollo]|uniref:(apollo) hypothetical protein n=1 Tax=Parnassius apollo TaxID=110799 RepID=A0A8S3XQ01_PARAO|nr:unnamed protein product [Parnassius apollo]